MAVKRANAISNSNHDSFHRNNSLLPVLSLYSSSSSSSASSSSAALAAIKNSNFKVTALVSKSVTLTCSIDLDDKNFSKSGNYKIIWSRETDHGKDYEPLALDDTRLIQNTRIISTRYVINKQTHDQIQWNLVINNLSLTDSNNYICQLNRKPYDVYWLKRFMLNVYEPASFVEDDENDGNINSTNNQESSLFVKNIKEYDDFKLKCLARGKPKPSISWYLKYLNGTSIQLDVDNSEIVIKNIKRTSKLDKIECQITNGYGPSATRAFKINIKYSPSIVAKARLYRVPIRTAELKLNCTVLSNPLSTIKWYFIPNEFLQNDNSLNLAHSETNFDYLDNLPKHEWRLLNSVASYSFKHTNFNHIQEHRNENSSFIKFPLSKYQIHEKHLHSCQINSILNIRLISEKDFGVYRCIASNEIGNKTADYKVQELGYESALNSEKMRSIMKDDKHHTDMNSVERSRKFQKSKHNKINNSNEKLSSNNHDRLTNNQNDLEENNSVASSSERKESKEKNDETANDEEHNEEHEYFVVLYFN